MNTQPNHAAASVYRLLLADEIALALTSGNSVAATGTRHTSEILDLTAAALVETGARVLQFRPPLDGASLVTQFADQWRITGKGSRAIPPKASSQRFMMLFHDAHEMTPEAFLQLDRMATTWPGMQMAFAGLPRLANTLQSGPHPAIKHRLTVFTKIAIPEHPPAPPQTPASIPAPKQQKPDQPPPAFTIPNRPPDYPPPKPPRPTFRWIATFAIVISGAALAASASPTPQIHQWAGTIRTYVSKLTSTPTPNVQSSDVAIATSANPPEKDARRTEEAKTLPDPLRSDQALATPSEPVPPTLQTSPPQNPASTTTQIEPPDPPPHPAQPPPTTSSALSPELAEAMTRRGRAMLEWGDVSAARLLLARATIAGSAAAALAMGTTFDPATLDRIGAVGIVPDPVQAAAWYRAALTLGEQHAQALLDNLPTSIATAKPKDAP